MKNRRQIFIVVLMVMSTISPLALQAQTVCQRITSALPQPSLPSWAKGPGWQAAIKWGKAGFNENALDTQEKKAFTAFKKKFTLAAIGAAVALALGVSGMRYYAYAKGAPERAQQEAQKQAQEKEVGMLQEARKNPNTFLSYGITTNNRDRVIAALDAGADVNQPREGIYPLQIAAMKGNQEAVQLLLDGGANADLAYKNLTALDYALAKKHEDLAPILLQKMTNKSQLEKTKKRKDISSDMKKAIQRRIDELS